MQFIVGVYDEEGPPVPIPNTAVKLFGAENTWRAAARENRSMLTSFEALFTQSFFFFGFSDVNEIEIFLSILNMHGKKNLIVG